MVLPIANLLSYSQGLVEKELAVCVQVEGPLQSFYTWEGKVECAKEWRLMVKFLSPKASLLTIYWKENHPYSIPEWICVSPSFVDEKYLEWAKKTQR